MNQYGKVQYWDDRYMQDKESFEWYQRYPTIKPYLLPLLQKYQNPKILILGCGNSKLSENLYKEGYKNIINIDFSKVCINQMQVAYSNYETMKYLVMDACDMNFDNGNFDIVIDKGTLDSILCSDESSHNANRCVAEINRILQPNGSLFCVSYGIPDYRSQYFETIPGWNLNIEKIQKPIIDSVSQEEEEVGKGNEMNYHYIYVCQKNQD